MYRKILVPLDGSKLAECVLPHVELMAQGCGTEEIILISVTERLIALKRRTDYRDSVPPFPSSRPVTELPLTVGKKHQQAEKYLTRIAKRLYARGIAVRTQVLLGNPAEEIVVYAQKNDCDLIVMASHGRSGVSRWTHSIGAYGGVADKVLRASPVPVLMVKSMPSEPDE